MEVEEMRMLRWIASISAKLCEGRLRWFGYVQRKASNAPVRTRKSIIVDGKKRSRKT